MAKPLLLDNKPGLTVQLLTSWAMENSKLTLQKEISL